MRAGLRGATRGAPLLLLLSLIPGVLHAQLPGASARALGMGGAYSLSARGFEAPAWNPAILAIPGGFGVTIGLPQGAAELGSNAYGFGDVLTYANVRLTDADKTTLLSRIDTTLRIRMRAGVSPIGISVGHFALSLTSEGEGDAGLGKDAVELALRGNASRSGPGEFFTAANSNASGWAITTLAASVAVPIAVRFGDLSLGATVKKQWGQGLGRAAELDSHASVNPGFDLHGSGHAIYTAYPAGSASGVGLLLGANAPGRGYGVDVGAALALRSGLTLGAVLVNVVGGMSWDASRLRYERVAMQLGQNEDGAITDSTVRTSLVGAAIATDPVAAAFKDSLLEHASLARLLRTGATYRTGNLLIAIDAMVRIGQGIDRPPAQSFSGGLEYVVFGFLPLRTGVSTDLGGSRAFSAGTGLRLGAVRVDVAVASLSGPIQRGVRIGAGLSLMFGRASFGPTGVARSR